MSRGTTMTGGPQRPPLTFSSRLPFGERPNRLSERLAVRHVDIDLTTSNPTLAVPYPEAELAAAFADPGLARYQPAPAGLASAREAVAAQVGAKPEDVILTASTSEAYAWLLKLLCDPGDVVLAPEPSYPLFEHLLALEGVRLRPYRLAYDGDWHLDAASLEPAGARAILVVSPGNPTGAYLTAEDHERLGATGLPLVIDEVFAPYPFADTPPARPSDRVLTFHLGGLSKGAGLPQLKLGWIVAGGPEAERRAALARLELIADSYLSVSTPVMLAAPRLLALGETIRARLLERVRRNRAALLDAPGRYQVLRAEAGWSAILRFPRTASDEELALRLLDVAGVLVHPGYFFDLPIESCLVVSLLPEPSRFDRGLRALAEL